MDTLIKKQTLRKAQAKSQTNAVASKKVGNHSKPAAYARFDTRLSKETKDLLERAALIKGFKSLSEFVIHFSSEAALSIIERHNLILASDRDNAIFFDALLNPPAPNSAMVNAAKRYKAQIEEK
jgi:uncharacterized protein (DUF1778 family)